MKQKLGNLDTQFFAYTQFTVPVANPGLFEVQCKTPRQIELANAFCRYLEIAQIA